MVIGFHLNINYFEFHAFADGMMVIMACLSLLLAIKNKKIVFLIYTLSIVVALWSYHIIDQYYEVGKNGHYQNSIEPEITILSSVIYILYISFQFKIRYRDLLFKQYFLPSIAVCLISMALGFTLKSINHLSFLKPLYIACNIIASYYMSVFLFKLYQMKVRMDKFFIWGTTVIMIGHTIRIIIAFSENLDKVPNFNNIFTIRGVYIEIASIIEAILIFISISETHRLDEEERKVLNQQLIEDFNTKTTSSQNFLLLQKTLYHTLQQQITQNLNKIVSHAQQVKVSLNSFLNTETNRQRIDEMIDLSNIGISNLRSIIRNLTQNDEEHSLLLKLQNTISESIDYQKAPVDLYVSPSEVVLDRESERQTIGALRKVLSILPQQQNKVLINISVSDELQMLVQSEIMQEYIPNAKRKADEAKYFMDKNNHRFDYFFDDGEIGTYQVSIPLFIHHN